MSLELDLLFDTSTMRAYDRGRLDLLVSRGEPVPSDIVRALLDHIDDLGAVLDRGAAEGREFEPDGALQEDLNTLRADNRALRSRLDRFEAWMQTKPPL